jgi:hypothetical protein
LNTPTIRRLTLSCRHQLSDGSAPTSLGIIGGGDVSSGSPLGIFGTLGGNTGGLGGQIGNALGGGAGGGGGGPGGTLGGLLGGSGNVGSGSPPATSVRLAAILRALELAVVIRERTAAPVHQSS